MPFTASVLSFKAPVFSSIASRDWRADRRACRAVAMSRGSPVARA